MGVLSGIADHCFLLDYMYSVFYFQYLSSRLGGEYHEVCCLCISFVASKGWKFPIALLLLMIYFLKHFLLPFMALVSCTRTLVF